MLRILSYVTKGILLGNEALGRSGGVNAVGCIRSLFSTPSCMDCASLSNHMAVFEIIEILTSFGANLDSTTACGETVFEICEDDKMRERLVLLKEELKRRQSQHNEQQQNWSNKARGLVRRRSSNPRRRITQRPLLIILFYSASIRRSSMREKAKLSWKEARLEAETCSLVVSTEDGACVQEEAKAPVWMTSATVDGTDSQRKSNGEQHSVAAVTDGTVKNNSHVRGSSGRLSTSRSHQQPPSNHSPSRGGGTGRASEAQRPISPSETSPNTSSKKPRTGSRPTVVEGAAAQPLPERPTPSCPSRSRSPPSASWNGSNKAGPSSVLRDHSTRRPKTCDSSLTSDHILRRHPSNPPLLENNARNTSTATAHTGALRMPGSANPGTVGVTFNHKSSSMKESRPSVTNGTSNSAILQHNAYYSPLDQQLRQSPPSLKWRSPPASNTMDRRDSRNWSASKSPCQPQVLFSSGTEPTGGIVANPLLTPGSSLTRPPPKRELISRSNFRDQDQLTGKCCVIM
ncbi:unnamed protein product [Schistocephalus solidus]|uniref:ANK_REP_REGION domain-containing protein n=1 Tax=Schistocephalus solidus TaxID=70667 RepID=A0A183SKW8_SCHSO|nr:unnamed protein product [Schistocephalus solidus]